MPELLIYLYPDNVSDNAMIEADVVGDRIEDEDEPPMWEVRVLNDDDVNKVLQRAVTAAGFGEIANVQHEEFITSSPAYTVTLKEA
jgi:hypothetical protein